LRFSPTSPNHLLVSSWDSQVRLYDVENNTVKSSVRHRAAVLACAFDPNTQFAYSGGLDTWVRRLDLETEGVRVLGAHEASVSCTAYSHQTNQLITGSWDRTLKFWDPRKGNPNSLISSHEQPERVYTIDLVEHTLLVATAARHVVHYDIRNMDSPIENRATALKFGTASLACIPTGEGYATGSVEGRVSIEYFDKSPQVQKAKYAFKCHRQTIPKGDLVFPINALAFHTRYGTLATGGSDGTVAVWDHRAKKRIKLYNRLPTAISALAFNNDGTRLAIGVSSMHDVSSDERKKELIKTGDDPNHVSIVVKTVGEELKRKSSS